MLNSDNNWNLCFVLLLLTVPIHGDVDLKILFGNKSCATPINCPYVPRGKVLPQPQQCCHNITQAFHCSWIFHESSLTTFLQILQSWNCTNELEHECRGRAFQWSDFTSNVYLSFCDRGNLYRKCLSKVQSIELEERNSSVVVTNEAWENAVSKIDPEKLKDEDVIEPCVQIAMYEGDDGGNFVELFEYRFLVCDLIWNGVGILSLKKESFSFWNFLSSRCKINVLVTAIILIVLGIIALTLNSIFILTVLTVPTLHHGQYIYRTSIALSDCFMAVLIFPSMIYQLYEQTHGMNRRFIRFHSNESNTMLALMRPTETFGQPYLYSFGIITNVIVFVSIYTLLIAAADRFYAVTWPYKYRRSELNPGHVVLLIWCVGTVVFLAPFFTDSFRYEVRLNIIIMMVGRFYEVVYIVILGLPVPIMWILSICTFASITRSRRRATSLRATSLRARNREENNNQEVRLAVVLLFMVGAFTLSMLPGAGIFLSHFVIPQVSYRDASKIDMNFQSTFILLEWIALMLFLFNTMWNFLIYNARDKEFKAAFHLFKEKFAFAIGCTALHSKLRTKRLQKRTTLSKRSQQSGGNVLQESRL